MKILRRLFTQITRLWRFTRHDCEVRIRLCQPITGVTLIALLIWLIVAPQPLALTGLVTLGSPVVQLRMIVR